ncbi:TPA: filamentous hemagglutinin N-terminal domain-containing protein, partial [Salmonella enterica]|nr:filamentous hemagglutinin N-terminal domain-containing protein [Salmonella enterica]
MNRIYKLKFDRRRNALVVVSELTTGTGKAESTGHVADLLSSPFRKLLGTLTPLALLTGLLIGVLPMMALANAPLPTGGHVVAGSGSISSSSNQMTVQQNSQNMVASWNTFDIGKNNTVQFVQPGSSAVALNRVTGGRESQILGTLKANGQVMLINPAGVMFGHGAQVNTAGLLASTKNISNADFMKGQYTLSGEGNPGAQVVNQGSLTTSKGGYIVLAGERVINSGTITTPGGKTVLAAGRTVTLQLDNGGLTSVSVNGSVVNALVDNQGLISATNGQVYLTAKGQDMLLNTVVNNSGTIEAKGLGSRGGEIVLNGGDSGVVSQSGQLLADSQTGQGGKITLEGQNIHLAANSLTSATGKTGGGEVYVGGGWQGKDSRIKNASKVVMDKTATVDVSATDAGDGGTAVLWSDDYTNFRGTILARGGVLSGNGGRVETSSHNNLQAFGHVDASTPQGQGGEWLLDPLDVAIVGTGSTDTNVSNASGIFTPTASGAQILNSSINSQLNAGTNVTVRTNGTDAGTQWGNITVNAAIAKTSGGNASLNLEADGNINVNQNITSTAGKLDINLLAGGSHSSIINVNNSTLNSNGGNITLNQLNHTNSVYAMTVAVKGSTLNATGSSGNGSISISVWNPNVNLNDTSLSSIRNGNALLQVSNSTLLGENITLIGTQNGANSSGFPVFLTNATLNATQNITLTGMADSNSRAVDLELRALNALNAGGNISINNTQGGNGLVYLNGSASGVSNLTAGDNINISGKAVGIQGNATERVNLTSQKGNITLSGMGPASTQITGINSFNVNYIAKKGGITLNGKTGVDKKAAIRLAAGVSFDSLLNTLIGVATGGGGAFEAHGMIIESGANVSFNGNTNIDVSSTSTAGLFLKGAALQVFLSNGTVNINATSTQTAVWTGGGAITAQNSGVFNFNLSNASLNLNATAFNSAILDRSETSGSSPTYKFTGVGDVHIMGSSTSTSNSRGNPPGIILPNIDRGGLTGNLSITGQSYLGEGVKIQKALKLSDVSLTGTSNLSPGVLITPGDNLVDFSNVSVTGTSGSSDGVRIQGGNINITGGNVNGTANSSGVGVNLSSGGNNYTLSDTTVTGQSKNGAGIRVSGNMSLLNGIKLSGVASGTGSGVVIAGNNLSISDSLNITGNASSGDGIAITSGTNLTKTSLTGNSNMGKGVNVSANLTLDSTSNIAGTSVEGTGTVLSGNLSGTGTVSGNSTSGNGVNVSVNLTGANISGRTDSGVGISLSDDIQVQNSTLNGSASLVGKGVEITGNLTLDEASALALKAHSFGGVGLSLRDAVVDIVSNVSASTPVTSAVNLSGTSELGAGVGTLGNITLYGVMLNGSASGDTGIGVSMQDGNVTLGDNISSINATAINGTALFMDDITLNATNHGSVPLSLNISVTGTNGTAIRTAGNTTLINTELAGHSEGGYGVNITGNLSTDQSVSGTSTSGTGTELSG